MNNIQGMKVGIVGGSVAGSAAAILLKRLGADVVLYERSARPLLGRGAGVVLPIPFMQQCIQQDLFDHDIPYTSVASRVFVTQKNQQIWEQPMVAAAFNWGDIYSNLKKRISSDYYRVNESVIDIAYANQKVIIQTEKQNDQFDLIIAADGIDSFIRKKIFPQLEMNYAGYIAWRGTLDMNDVADKTIFENHAPYFVFQNGHILLYRIPASDYSTTKHSLLNWIYYKTYSKAALEKLLIDNQGKKRSVSLPPGTLSAEHLQQLHQSAKCDLPTQIAEIVCKTPEPFMQAIFDMQVPEYFCQNVCLIGDAATALRPHSASGAFKALADSLSLAQAMSSTGKEFVSALQEWNTAQLKMAKEQLALAKNMGNALVSNAPAWEEMNPTLMNEWWASVVSGKSWYATESK